MEKMRLMSFDLDSFVLVKSSFQTNRNFINNRVDIVNKVLEFIRRLDIDLALLQGDDNLLYAILCQVEDYKTVANYVYNIFLMEPNLNFGGIYSGDKLSATIFNFYNNLISIYNIKKFEKTDIREFKKIKKELSFIENMVLAGNFRGVDINNFCRRYNLTDVCSNIMNNHILVSSNIDANVVLDETIEGAFSDPMVVDISYKKVR